MLLFFFIRVQIELKILYLDTASCIIAHLDVFETWRAVLHCHFIFPEKPMFLIGDRESTRIAYP